MQQLPWTPLTEKPEISFVGALTENYMKPWDLTLLESEAPENEPQASFIVLPDSTCVFQTKVGQ
jgi:hypothetical protein